jgi:hypothetical protein
MPYHGAWPRSPSLRAFRRGRSVTRAPTSCVKVFKPVNGPSHRSDGVRNESSAMLWMAASGCVIRMDCCADSLFDVVVASTAAAERRKRRANSFIAVAPMQYFMCIFVCVCVCMCMCMRMRMYMYRRDSTAMPSVSLQSRSGIRASAQGKTDDTIR